MLRNLHDKSSFSSTPKTWKRKPSLKHCKKNLMNKKFFPMRLNTAKRWIIFLIVLLQIFIVAVHCWDLLSVCRKYISGDGRSVPVEFDGFRQLNDEQTKISSPRWPYFSQYNEINEICPISKDKVTAGEVSATTKKMVQEESNSDVGHKMEETLPLPVHNEDASFKKMSAEFEDMAVLSGDSVEYVSHRSLCFVEPYYKHYYYNTYHDREFSKGKVNEQDKIESKPHLNDYIQVSHEHYQENIYGYEKSEFDERGVLPDAQTKFVPPILSGNIKRALETEDIPTYRKKEQVNKLRAPTELKRRKMEDKEDKNDWGNAINPVCGIKTMKDLHPKLLFSEIYLQENDVEDRAFVEKDGKYKCLDTRITADKKERVKKQNSNEIEKNMAEEITSVKTEGWNKELQKFHDIRKKQSMKMQGYMDTTAHPCNDFYQYSCGNWGKINPIPKDKSAFDTFEILRENLDSVLKELLEEPYNSKSSTGVGGDAITKVKQLYRSCMNYDILQKRGTEPLMKLLSDLGGWPIMDPSWDPSTFDWLSLSARLRLYNNDILISEWIAPDIKNSTEYIIQFDQTTLGFTNRDYYLEASNRRFLEAYKNFMIEISNGLGVPDNKAQEAAEEIIHFEIELAKITSSPEKKRNVNHLYQRLTIEALQQMVPQIDWIHYLSIIIPKPISPSEPCVMFAMKYMQDLVVLLERTPRRTVANYMIWRFVWNRINNIDDRFDKVKQRFYNVLLGQEESPPRWKHCVAHANNNMGMAVGAMFVRKYFDENSRNDTMAMTEDIMGSFRELVSKTTWIDEETKMLANVKVEAMQLRIGYPDYILNPKLLNERYHQVIIDPELYFENVLNLLEYLTQREQSHLGKTVNKSTWNTAPPVVNAYYSRNKNQIMVPAGILQPPFYHRYFPRSLNYGGIGVVIGHEITHGFDDKGRLFDKDGNLHRWWHDEAIYNFHKRAQCLIDQYSHYILEEVNEPVDGLNSQGENIADNGGIKEAFRAYQRWLSTHGDAYENLPDFPVNNLQLFFINFAQVWCGETRPEAVLGKFKNAVHAPGKFRVIGTLSNSKDFAEVFNCQLGSPMNPAKKCEVW